MYIVKLYKDYKLWRKFFKVIKEQEKVLNEYNMRIDSIGRIYTVVNIPIEIAQHDESVQTAWVFKELKPYNEILLKLGLSGYVYPEVKKINIKNSIAYLVFLYPEYEYLKFNKVFVFVLKLVGLYFLIRLLLKILLKFIDIESVIGFLKDLV